MTSLAFQAASHPEVLRGYTEADLAKLEFSWDFWGRPAQQEPEPFKTGRALIWLLLTGRGWGKTVTGAQTVRRRVNQKQARSIGLVSQSASDARDVMVTGGVAEPLLQQGIISVCRPDDPAGMPVYHPSKRSITWPNGAIARIFTAEDPDAVRGANLDFAWCDELAAWPHLTIQATWDNLMLALRQGASQCIITTTPKPIALVKDLIKRSQGDNATVYVTKGSTYDNLQNLSEGYKTTVVTQYQGTRLGEQELHAKLLEDIPGALWHYADIEAHRIANEDFDIAADIKRIVVAVDPSGSSKGHECGIMVGGLGWNGEGYLLADKSLTASPQKWGQEVIDAYDNWMADSIVVETNFGAEMVKQTLHNIRPGLPIKEVRATQGKRIRAEPIAALYEQGKVHHVGFDNKNRSYFELLESQMTEWMPEEGPNDRVDALVWLFTELKPARPAAHVWFRDAPQKGNNTFVNGRAGISTLTGEYRW